jgi:hypothetical protein
MNESIRRSSGNEFDGSVFSNKLFSNLAPLLTPFVEQVTKQLLSQTVHGPYHPDATLIFIF